MALLCVNCFGLLCVALALLPYFALSPPCLLCSYCFALLCLLVRRSAFLPCRCFDLRDLPYYLIIFAVLSLLIALFCFMLLSLLCLTLLPLIVCFVSLCFPLHCLLFSLCSDLIAFICFAVACYLFASQQLPRSEFLATVKVRSTSMSLTNYKSSVD